MGVRVTGMQFERELPLSGVLDAIRPLRHHVDRLPEAARLRTRDRAHLRESPVGCKEQGLS